MSRDLTSEVRTLRDRLDLLASEPLEPPSIADQLWSFTHREAVRCRRLLEQDRVIERAGLHTLADARLLRSLMRDDPRLAQAGQRLVRGAGRAVHELSVRIAQA
ncbi:MAG: hypothetical protein HY901_30635, partial [Deltaproteobacteria bacterium]|nr:hypothetical protein [Deltaproteobacteria bacterium]